MVKNRLQIYLLIFLSGLFISACAQLGLQSKKETEEPALISDCKKNYTKEGIWPFKRVYKTWVRYDPLDYKKGFDTAVMVLKAQGHRATYTDRESGTIKAEMTLESQEQKTHPVDIKLVKEKTSLTVYLSSESASGTSGQECFCGFYEEFEKSTKRTLTASQPNRPSYLPRNLQNQIRNPLQPRHPLWQLQSPLPLLLPHPPTS